MSRTLASEMVRVSNTRNIFSIFLRGVLIHVLTARTDKFLSSQLILISRDCVAHYWEDLDHISYFYRVDIDELLRT